MLRDALVKGWIDHFWAADHEIEWVAAEVEPEPLKLAPGVLLVGRIDAIGRDAQGELFFGEWKTSAPEWRTRKGQWKQTYRLNPQTLTYGVIADSLYPGCRRFTVRKAFKSEPPSYDHAWYSYSEEELGEWKRQLVRLAIEIGVYRGLKPWPTNFNACFKYGLAYPCPFFDPACSKMDFDGKPKDALVRVSHLESERRLNERESVIVLDATRVATWFDCRERYRRMYVESVAVPPSEAMQLGTDFHALVGEYYKQLIAAPGTAEGITADLAE